MRYFGLLFIVQRSAYKSGNKRVGPSGTVSQMKLRIYLLCALIEGMVVVDCL